MRASTVLAIDIGGTKIATGLLTSDGTLLRTIATPTPVQNDPETLLSVVLAAVEQIGADSYHAVGVGCAGPMTPGGRSVSPLNIPAWRDFPLLERLEQALRKPVVIDGDAKALAVGEGWLGVAAGVRDFLAMVVSTGVGGGLVVDGRLLHGAGSNAGHVGHVIVVPDGAQCGCGARGCLEAEISGTAIARRIGAPAEKAPVSEVLRAGKLLGLGLASTVNLLDLSMVAVGGSVALGFGAPFFSAVSRGLRANSRLSFTQDCQIEPVGLGKDGPVIGAGALALQLLGHDVGTS